MNVAVVAEKPSVARDIARVLKATQQGQGYLHGNGYVVTWAIGHLVALPQPQDIRPEWRSWRRELLPMLPHVWPLAPVAETKDQYEVVRKIITSARIGEIVCATDAGREGELIFRYIYEAAGSDKPVRRLWISSLTPDAIRDGFAKLRDGHDYDNLADAAKGRSRADWLVGLNLSRAYTLACDQEYSVGRVQTPTLAMVVDRELTIRAFVPEDYLYVVAKFSPAEGQSYDGVWFRPGVDPMDAAKKLPPDGEEAGTIVERTRAGTAVVESIEAQTKRMSPPLLYDLTELQRHGNRLYGFSAKQTLDIAQGLYEKHKLISYPRTDSRHLSADIAVTLPKVINAIKPEYDAKMIAPGTGLKPLSKRYVDDTKVSDHHAIIPTGVDPSRIQMTPDERKIFDLIARRLLAAWHEDHIWSVTTVITLVRNAAANSEDRFHSTGTLVQQEGWKVTDIVTAKEKKRKKPKEGEAAADDDDESSAVLPPMLERDQPQTVVDVDSVHKKTTPPKRLTEATLLTAMETAGKTLDDKELSDAMKDSGLGTPATRASIIEVLLKRGFIERNGKSLVAMDKGIALIEVVHPDVKSPAMTGQWEAYLKRIERGQAELNPFLKGIEDYVTEVVGKAWSARPASTIPPPPKPVAFRTTPVKSLDAPAGTLQEILKQRFGFDQFRANQEAVCTALAGGDDVLLVMPTGSGKSLCFQLPAILRGGTALVVSPLIALMEDQVAKLQSLGFAAERIHSGRDRAISRDVCKAYLAGQLDFLFIAPERMRVQGFPEMLAKRPLSLVAIDEAHCISQWGHDFRPDYRMIGHYLPALRPAPVIALTATATPLVQNDIALQLGLSAPRRFIHGFRRDNIAIEVVEVTPSERFGLANRILSDGSRRPAIVYVPKRKDAVTLAAELGSEFPVAAYHAGLESHVRDAVQAKFQAGKLEIIVATIAFGMGIDKPDIRTVIHTALPGSVEGYYQEIGRAGRDGEPSRAILMHSYADRRTHDYFFERDYPDAASLARIFDALTDVPQPKDAVRKRAKLDPEEFDVALEKLWIHTGALVDYEENVAKGDAEWRASYLEQRDHKKAQFEKMISYTDTTTCRMSSLVRYFGDLEDKQQRCGTCDFCDATSMVAQQLRPANGDEQEKIERILTALKLGNAVATGRLFTETFPDGRLERRDFEDLLAAIARAGLIDLTEASFEKDGRRIAYRKAIITSAGKEEDVAGEVMVPEGAAGGGGGPRKRKKAVAAKPKNAADEHTEKALREWRMKEAKKKGVPAFRILSDKVLSAIVDSRPESNADLLEVPGVGQKLVEKFGAQIFRVLAGR